MGFLSRKIKWTPLVASEKALHDLFIIGDTVVHHTMFGTVLLVRNSEKVYAFKNQCPHQNKPMDGCWVENDTVVCPFHQYKYTLETGRGQGLYLEQYELKITDEGVFLGKEGWSLF